MKSIFRYILIIASVLLVASCVEKLSDAEILDGKERVQIEVVYSVAGDEVESVTLDHTSMKKVLEVKVNNEGLKWNLESNRDWCKVIPESHCGSGSVTLEITGNGDFEDRDPATLTFVAGNYRGSRIEVYQKASSILVGKPYYVATASEKTYEINVRSREGVKWSFLAEDWMSVRKGAISSADGVVTTSLIMEVSSNDGASRLGSLIITDGICTELTSVYQFGNDVPCDENGNILFEASEEAKFVLKAPAYVVSDVTVPSFATLSVVENQEGIDIFTVDFEENLSDLGSSRAVEIAMSLSNGSPVEFPKMKQDYILANGLVTVDGMLAFVNAVANGASTELWETDGVVTLKKNIDMAELSEWPGIGTAQSSFKGKFDGNGYVFTNLKTSNGLFNYCEGAKISNVKLGKGCNLVFKEDYAGEVYLGAIVSIAKSTEIADCEFAATMDFAGKGSSEAYVGGIVGYADEQSTVTRSKMTGEMTISSSETAMVSNVGGIAGKILGTLSANEMSGEIILASGNTLLVGGIIGALAEQTTVKNNTFVGTLSLNGGKSSNMALGGLYGSILQDRVFDSASDNSVSAGQINVNAYVGSTSTLLYVGGFAATAGPDVDLTFKGYDSRTKIYYDQTENRPTSYACFGGIFGGCDPEGTCKSIKFENLSNYGTFSTAYNSKNALTLTHGFVGGIAGFVNGKATFTACSNNAELGKIPDAAYNSRSNGYSMVFGGVAGVIIGGDAAFISCTNAAPITNWFYSNHFVGNSNGDWWSPCVAAGILGAFDYTKTSLGGKLTMTDCENSAQIRSLRGNVGGILGYARRATIANCTSIANLDRLYTDAATHDAAYKGGIAAWVENAEIKNCVAKGLVYGCAPGNAMQHPAGIVAYAQGDVTVESCSYYGRIMSLAATDGREPVCGGIVAESEAGTVVKDCKYGYEVDGTPITTNNVADYAIGKGAGTCIGIQLWSGNL